MPTFILQHIDALITTTGGLVGCFYGYRRPRSGRVATPSQQRAMKILRVCGPLVVLFGLVRFFIDQPSVPTWQRYATTDGFASAEFPAIPQAKQQTDTINGIRVQRTSLTYDVPFKTISMFLSFSSIPPSELNLPDTDRIAAIKSYSTQQGLSVVREAPMHFGASSGFALDFQGDGGKTRVWTRLAIVAGKVYRVVVSSAGAHHNDPVIGHYLDSFRIEPTGS